MSELRAGGLAIVISSKIPELVGACVTLIELLHPGPFTYEGVRHVFAGDGPAWLVAIPEGALPLRPRQLMPLDGHDFTEEDREKEKVHG